MCFHQLEDHFKSNLATEYLSESNKMNWCHVGVRSRLHLKIQKDGLKDVLSHKVSTSYQG